jgi:hypothetical protein
LNKNPLLDFGTRLLKKRDVGNLKVVRTEMDIRDLLTKQLIPTNLNIVVHIDL